MKKKKIINIILNCLIVLSVIYAFSLKNLNDKYDNLYNDKYDNLYNEELSYVIETSSDDKEIKIVDVFNKKMNEKIIIDDIALKADYVESTNRTKNCCDKTIGPYIEWPMAPKFYNNLDMSIDVYRKTYSFLRYCPFYEKVVLNYQGKKMDITNKFIISDTEVVDLDAEYQYFDLIMIFPYKDDIYMCAPISTKLNLKKNITAYEDYSNNNYYGYSFSNGSLKYALINLTSNEKTKVITIDEKTKKADIKENKYVKKMHKSGINVFNCFEVEDNIQVVFNNIEDIKNVKVKEKIIESLKKAYSDIPKDKPIVVSIKKKDFNKFVDIISGGK